MKWQRHTDPAVVEQLVHFLPPGLEALDGTRIVQVSDLHVGRYMRSERWAAHIERIHTLSPDLVVITGDAMDWGRQYESDFIDPLSGLEARHGVLAVLGNHDFYFGVRRLARGYSERTHVGLLRGEPWRTDALPGLVVWGLDDPMSNLARPGRYPLIDSWGARLDSGCFNLLLAHRPDAFPAAARAGFDLQLSGHTHGGQIHVTTPLGRVHFSSVLGPYDLGSFERPGVGPERLSRLYVNRGLGYTGLPYRRNCSTEITLVELRATPSNLSLPQF